MHRQEFIGSINRRRSYEMVNQILALSGVSRVKNTGYRSICRCGSSRMLIRCILGIILTENKKRQAWRIIRRRGSTAKKSVTNDMFVF